MPQMRAISRGAGSWLRPSANLPCPRAPHIAGCAGPRRAIRRMARLRARNRGRARLVRVRGAHWPLARRRGWRCGLRSRSGPPNQPRGFRKTSRPGFLTVPARSVFFTPLFFVAYLGNATRRKAVAHRWASWRARCRRSHSRNPTAAVAKEPPVRTNADAALRSRLAAPAGRS